MIVAYRLMALFFISVGVGIGAFGVYKDSHWGIAFGGVVAGAALWFVNQPKVESFGSFVAKLVANVMPGGRRSTDPPASGAP